MSVETGTVPASAAESIRWLLPHERWVATRMDRRRQRGLGNPKFESQMGPVGVDLFVVGSVSPLLGALIFIICFIASIATAFRPNLLGWAMIPLLLFCGLGLLRVRQSKAASRAFVQTTSPHPEPSLTSGDPGGSLRPSRRDKVIAWLLLVFGVYALVPGLVLTGASTTTGGRVAAAILCLIGIVLSWSGVHWLRAKVMRRSPARRTPPGGD